MLLPRPTYGGVAWLAAFFALLASAINYSNNLVFALAFVLLALWLQSAWRAHRHLQALQWLPHATAAAFAGQRLRAVGSFGQAQPGARLWLSAPGQGAAPTLADASGQGQCNLSLPAPQRGEQRLHGLRLVSDWPLGLWRAQRPLPDLVGLVYPCPGGAQTLPAQPPPPAHRRSASGDFQDLRRYAPGDAPRRINWRAFARRDALLVNCFDGEAGGGALWLDFADCEGGTEERLSQLCRWIEDAERDAREYGLRLPGLAVPAALGPEHRHQCLRHLALFGAPTTAGPERGAAPARGSAPAALRTAEVAP